MLEFFKRGQAALDVRLMAARGIVEAPAHELLAILVVLTRDDDDTVRKTAIETLGQLPAGAVRSVLDAGDVPDEVRQYFACQTVVAATPAGDGTAPADQALPADQTTQVNQTAPVDQAAPVDQTTPGELSDTSVLNDEIDDPELLSEDAPVERDSIVQKLAKMNFAQKLKAASKGTREVRAILVRDPSKMIAMAVLTSPKLTEPEVEAFARMGNVSEDVLRYIGSNRVWMKNYGVVLALCKNAKTPLGLSLNMMNRLNDRDLQGLSTDRNVPEPLRIAARKKVVNAVSR